MARNSSSGCGPLDGLIAMSQLHYDQQITKPTELADLAPKRAVAVEELALVRLLIEACTPATFDFGKYRDQYRTKLVQLIEAKVAGQEIVAAAPTKEMQVLSLM